MACACKVTRQLDFLHRKYGDNQPKSKKTNIIGSIKGKIMTVCTSVLIVPFFPFYIVRAMMTNRHGIFNIDKIFNLTKSKNVRKQQII